MELTVKNLLAGLAIGMACARSVEQLLPHVRSRLLGTAQTVPLRGSLLSPGAGFAALVYGHAIGADSALLIATWMHTSTALWNVIAARLCFQPAVETTEVTTQGGSHD